MIYEKYGSKMIEGKPFKIADIVSEMLLNTGTEKLELGKTTHHCPPFSIVNPVDKIEKMVNEKTKIKYGRNYAYGFCDAFSDEHSDFGRLYKLINCK